MPKILILTGPNLNLLGRREPEIYGHDTLDDIHAMCADEAQTLGYDIDCRQSNHEGMLVDWIQEAMDDFDGIIINAAAYTHTSIAIHDALKMTGKPIIEVHISDPDTREEFRHHSYIKPLAKQVIKGQGAKGYVLALQAFSTIL